MKPNSKEVFAQAAGHIFRSLGSMCDAAHAFYEAGYPDEGDKSIEAVSEMINNLPEFPE